MTKKQIRERIRIETPRILSDTYRKNASKSIVEQIVSHPFFLNAQKIALYHALADEPDLNDVFEHYSLSKELYIPRVEGEEIAFYKYKGEKDLSLGSFGISEPLEAVSSEAVDPLDLEMIIVPGMAFTKEGIRLGRGKGFYDRFLTRTQAKLIGTTFAFRILKEIPHDTWDHKVDLVITDKITKF